MRGRPPHIRDEDLLDAARDAFREDGHAATTAGIAKRAGVSEGILFYRYESKEALLAAVIDRETQPPASLRQVAVTAGTRPVADNLRHILETVLESVFRAHPFIELAITSPSSHLIHKALFSKNRPAPERIVDLLVEYFEAEARLGRIRPVAPALVARAVFGACFDHVRACRLGVQGDDRSAFVAGLVDLLLHGVASSTPREQ